MPSALAVRDLTVRFGRTVAVEHASLELPKGEILAVLGPSGCGKSTLLRAVAGLEEVSTGSVSYDGEDLAGVPTYRRGFALMFQDGQLFPHQSVAGNVGYPLRLRGRPRGEVGRRVEELLEMVGLAGFGERPPATLSGGERQRVALARALAVEPRLLLLDEPLSALDRGLRERLAGELRQILVAAGTTALLVTHDQEEAFAIADRMAVMRKGRIVQAGALDEVWRSPVDGDVARFLGYATVLTGDAATTVLDAAVAGGPGVSTGTPARPAVALRRSALRCDPEGGLRGQVLSAKVTPDLVRLTVDVDGVGEVHAVADRDSTVQVGHAVRLSVDLARTAVLPSDRRATGDVDQASGLP